jgi:2'-5' RNA ligase
MPLCVVAYPEVNVDDSAWIQTIRCEFDPQYNRIDPHFTLVFPTHTVETETVEAHLRAAVAGIAPFHFALRCALPIKDSFSAQTHLFLVPDEGFSDLVRLHSRLYTGPLKAHLRLDIPYIPHITIGVFVHAEECKEAADTLNAQSFAVAGRIERLSLLDVAPSSVTAKADIDLAT